MRTEVIIPIALKADRVWGEKAKVVMRNKPVPCRKTPRCGNVLMLLCSTVCWRDENLHKRNSVVQDSNARVLQRENSLAKKKTTEQTWPTHLGIVPISGPRCSIPETRNSNTSAPRVQVKWNSFAPFCQSVLEWVRVCLQKRAGVVKASDSPRQNSSTSGPNLE